MTPVSDRLARLVERATKRPWCVSEHWIESADGFTMLKAMPASMFSGSVFEQDSDLRLITALANCADEIVAVLRYAERCKHILADDHPAIALSAALAKHLPEEG